MKILDSIRNFAPSIPGMMMDIIGGTAGLFLPGYGRSSFAHLREGNLEGAYASAAINYLGVDVYGNSNTFGNMWSRASGMKIAILGKVVKALYNELV